MTSILTETKKTLNLSEEYTAFDTDIMLHINSVCSTLHQLGIGPAEGFMITSKNDQWEALLGDDLRLNMVKSYVFLRVRLLFDASSLTGPTLSAFQKQIEELEWRLNAVRESTEWVDPQGEASAFPTIPGDGLIISGGGA